MRNGPDKNPFKGVGDLVARGAPAKRTLHFLSYAIDMVIVAIVAYLVFLAGYSITTSSSAYQSNYARYEDEITYYQDMVVEAHAGEYLDRENDQLMDEEDIAIKMALQQVLLSYSHDNPESPEFAVDPLPALQAQYIGTYYADGFVSATFGNDYVSRFFIEYAPEHNPNNELVAYAGKTPERYVIDYYKDHVSSYSDLKFIYPAGESLPYLRPSVGYDLYRFLVRDEGYDRTTYDSFVGFYTAMLDDCQNRLFKADTYQKGHYQDYLTYRQAVIFAINSTLVISIALAYYLAVFLPQMIFKDGRSFGKIFMRLGVINIDKSEVEPWKYIVRSILGAISCFYLAFLIALFPPFNGASMILYLPYFSLGSLDITLLNLSIFMFAFAAINGIVMLLNHDKRSITDLIFQTMTVDVTLLDEPDYDERDETPA